MEEKVSLPTKTKIAAWWIRIMGIGIMVSGLYIILLGLYEIYRSLFFLALIISFIPLLIGWYFFDFPTRLSRRGKSTWIIIVIIFSLVVIICLILLISNRSEIIPEFKRIYSHWGDIWYIKYSDILRLFGVFILFFVPLILLLLDRKNFWKVAS
jgi:hypothetical protein